MDKSALTQEQITALGLTAAFLDIAAGEGIGVQVQKRDGGTINQFADELVLALVVAFDLSLSDGRFAFRDAVMARINNRDTPHG